MTQCGGNQHSVISLSSATWATRVSDVAQLTKSRITVMVVMTTFIGYQLGVGSGMAIDLVLLTTVLGTALSCMGACALNQVLERDTDALMNRTADRPIPAGRMTLATGSLIGVTLSFAGVGLLATGANALTALLSATTIVTYVLAYTPLKRITSVSTIVGAVPGALPPVMGYTAATGRIELPIVVVFLIMFLWQLPHFLAIAWLYREDYARAGMPMLPVVDPSGVSTFRQMLLGCLALLPLGLLPTMLRISGVVYFAGALLCGLMFLAAAIALVIRPTRARAKWVFYASLVYLPAVLALMMIDRV
jgi:protoheme IX farnesyltransferase